MSDSDQVKLKPFFGMEPGKYLVILYTAIIVAVIFLLFFLPGIVRPGSLIDFNSNPQRSVVFIDGKYQGQTPCKVFVSAGMHNLRIEKKHYTSVETEITSESRLFASLFVPKKASFSADVILEDPEALLSESFSEFAGWGMIDTYYDNYQPKPVIGPLFEDLEAAGYSDVTALSGFLYSIIPFVHNELLYQDFIEAVAVFEYIKTGEKPATDDLISSFTDIQFFKDSVEFFENLPFWFYSLLTDEHRENNFSWYPALQEEYGAFLRDFSNDYPAPQAAVTVNGMRFVMLTGGQFLIGADGTSFPYPAAVEDFMIMDREVTNDMFRLFLAENSEWRAENINSLMKAGLVNQDYLKDFDDSDGSTPVNFISWYAADAFCDWLEAKLPDYLSAYSVRLPDEHEWEWAAATDADATGIFSDSASTGPLSADGRMPNNSGLYDMKGNLWEWCSNWYAPAAPLITSRNPSYNEAFYGSYDGVEKSVRGGSWANEDNVSISARGSQSPEWCTEFLGFRPILVRK